MKAHAESPKELGLEVGLLFGRFFLGMEHLHYGLWKDGLELKVANFPKAQENLCEFMLSHFPEGVASVLDVGSGAGEFARRIKDRGCEIDCVSPSPLLNSHTRTKLGAGSRVYDLRFEELSPDRKYDMVLFSESFQYVPVTKAISGAVSALNDSGYLFICDFFRTGAPGKSLMGGGHDLARFRAEMERQPFRLLEEVDITAETAPSMDLMADFFRTVMEPMHDSLQDYIRFKHRFVAKFLNWKFRRKLEKMRSKYFGGVIDGKHFATHKSYRLFLFQKMSAE